MNKYATSSAIRRQIQRQPWDRFWFPLKCRIASQIENQVVHQVADRVRICVKNEGWEQIVYPAFGWIAEQAEEDW